MPDRSSRRENLCSSLKRTVAAISIGALAAAIPAVAQNSRNNHNRFFFFPGNLVVSRSVYDNNPNNVQVGETLPPNCAATQGGCAGPATYDGTYPFVFNDNLVDGSFGVTSKIYLDQMFPLFGFVINSLEVPNNAQHGYNG